MWWASIHRRGVSEHAARANHPRPGKHRFDLRGLPSRRVEYRRTGERVVRAQEVVEKDAAILQYAKVKL